MKLLVVLAAIALLVWLMRGGRRRKDEAPPAAAARKPAPPAAARITAPENMVRCDTCGLHLPASDALPAPDGRHFCCPEHRR